jgi:hypothetical protein
VTAKRSHCLIASRDRESVRQHNSRLRRDDSRSCRQMISSRRWTGCFRCWFDGSPSQRFSGLAVRSPPRTSVPRTPPRFQTHQSIKLCHGRKNHRKPREFVENLRKLPARGAARDARAKCGRRLGSRDLRLHQLGAEESMTPELESLLIWSEPSDHLVVTVALHCHSPGLISTS